MNVKTLDMRTFTDDRGELSVGEFGKEIPFPIKRIYYIYNVPSEEIRRGYHSHNKLQQVFLCLSGSCTLLFDDGNEKRTITLKSPKESVYVGPGIWREMYNFSKNAVLMVLASETYDENDYIRNYDEFIKDKS